MTTSIQNEFYLYLTARETEDGSLEAGCTLPATLDLSRSNYQISLVELQLPGIWHNVYDATITYWAMDTPDERTVVRIPDGYYKNMDILVRTIDRVTKRAEFKLQKKLANLFFKLVRTESGKDYVAMQANVALRFSDRFVEIFGLGSPYMANQAEEERRMLIHPDVHKWQYSLIAECNVAPVSSVGSYSGKVLRVFSPQREEISAINVHQIYVPVIANMLDRISVTLKDMRGHQLNFEKDEMLIVIHLKKVIKA